MRKYYAFCMTINNPIDSDYNNIRDFDNPEKRAFMVVGHENFRAQTFMEKRRGIKPTPHLQMFVVCNREMSFYEMKNAFPRAHIEVARKFYEGFFYCFKEGYFTVTGCLTVAWSKWLIQLERRERHLESKKKREGEYKGEGVSVTPSSPPPDDSEPFGFHQWEADRLIRREDGLRGYWND